MAGEFQDPKLLFGYGAKPYVLQYRFKERKDGKIVVDVEMAEMKQEDLEKFMASYGQKTFYTNGVLNVPKSFVEGGENKSVWF